MRIKTAGVPLLVFLFLLGRSMSAQTELHDPKKIAALRVKSVTVSECQQEFGKPDTCTSNVIYTYDREGRIIKTVSQPHEAGQTTTYTYNSKGQRIQVQHVLGPDTNTTINEYDANGNRTRSISKKNGKIASTTTWVFEGTRMVSSVRKNEKEEIIGETTSSFDQARGITIHTWTSKESNHKSITYYDGNGHRLLDSVMTFDGQFTAAYSYVYINDTIASKKTFNIKGYVSETRYTYDSLQRLIRTDHIDSTNPYNSYITKCVYDSAGNLVEITDARGANEFSRYYTYDTEGKVQMETRSSSERIINSYTYSGKGELLSQIESGRGGDSIIYTYDADGRRVTSKIIQPGNVNWVQYTYDKNGFMINEKRYFKYRPDSTLLYYEVDYINDLKGKHIQAIHKNYFNRNLALQLGSKNNSIPPSTFTMVYTYDLRDSLISIIGSNGMKDSRVTEQNVTYTYGRNGKAEEVNYYYAGSDQHRDRYVYEYDDSGRVEFIRHYYAKSESADQVVQFYYDSNNRVTHTCRFNSYGEMYEHTINIYDQNGQLIKVVEGEKVSTYRKYSYETY